MAEWLRSGLQSRLHRFDSGRRLYYRLADVIGDHDEYDRFWSGKGRACADQVRAGNADGLRNFVGLFGGMGSINDQAFSDVLRGDLSEAYGLASELLREHDRKMSRAG